MNENETMQPETAGAPGGSACERTPDEVLRDIAFLGEALTPFFLNDPRTGAAGASFAAIAALDAKEAAATWPFAAPKAAEEAFGLMVGGLSASFDARSGSFCADDELTWEYRRLFIGPAPKPAPPWGSVYTDRDQVMFGASTLALRAWMRAAGIARTQDEGMPEDHIGLMMALMAWIARDRPELLDDYLRLHLLTWSSHFLDELAAAAAHPFYKGLALLAKESLEGAGRARGLQVEYPRFYR